jgi:hypothetical protein
MTTARVGTSHVHNPSVAADVYPDDELVQELTDSLRPRLIRRRRKLISSTSCVQRSRNSLPYM